MCNLPTFDQTFLTQYLRSLNFFSPNFFRPTFFWTKLKLKLLTNNFWTQTLYRTQHFFRTNIFSKKKLVLKLFWTQNYLQTQNFLQNLNFFLPRISSVLYFFLTQHFFEPRICLGLGDFHWRHRQGKIPFQTEHFRLECFHILLEIIGV